MAKVMLVEDDNNLREIYEARLQAEGYTIVSAHDGEEALVVAKAEKPDLIISDVMMPKISGFEMLDILRNTDGLKDVKVIMLTALGQSDDQQRADRLGANRYLVKSQVTLEDIVKVAQELLNDGETAPAPVAAADPASPPPAVDTPVATEPPATDPTAAPTPTPGATDLDVTATPVGATPAADEAAQVQAQIASFEAAVPATPPAQVTPATDTPAPETTIATPLPDLTQVAPTEPAAAANDGVMADALESLAGTPPPTADPVAVPPPADATPTEGATDTPARPKKIIAPLNSNDPAKPDLNALLAQEEAKEAAGGASYPPVSNTPSATPVTPAAPPAPAAGTSGPDPSSIAL